MTEGNVAVVGALVTLIAAGVLFSPESLSIYAYVSATNFQDTECLKEQPWAVQSAEVHRRSMEVRDYSLALQYLTDRASKFKLVYLVATNL